MKSPNSKSGSKSESKTKRREFIKLIGSTALAWPTATWAQSPPNVGILIAATDAKDVWESYITTFKTTLNDLMQITPNYFAEPSNTGGNPNGAAGVGYSTYFAAAQKLISNDNVNIIVTAGNLAAQACKDAATQLSAANPIPIVVASAGDLTGLADGNLTGCTNGQQNLAILKERIKRMKIIFGSAVTGVGIVGNDTVPPVAWAMAQALSAIQQILKVPACLIPISQPSDLTDHTTIRNKINSSIPNTMSAAVNALYVCSDPLLRTHGGDFVQGAHDLPKMNTMHEFGEWVSIHKGDQSFGPDFTSLFQKAAEFVNQYFENGLPLPASFNPQVTDCVPTP